MPRWSILVVDDDLVIAAQTADILKSKPVSESDDTAEVETETSFDRALTRLRDRHYDLLVLDVRDQSRAGEDATDPDGTGTDATPADVGLDVFEEVRRRRFVPIIFYTAVPSLVMDRHNPPFVAVVSKNAPDETEDLRRSVRAVFDSTLPSIHQALLDHVEEIVRQFMAEFVEQHWSDLTDPSRKGDLAHLLLRRLALSLGTGGEVLAQRLADDPLVLTPEHVHPMRYYVVPPVGPSCTTGDLIVGPRVQVAAGGSALAEHSQTADQPAAAPVGEAPASDQSWYVVLTPACDLVARPTAKAEFVILAECVRLDDSEEYRRWRELRPSEGTEPSSEAKRAEKRLTLLLENNPEKRQKDRTVYLPAAWRVPDLLVDFQRIVHVGFEDLSRYERVATLDSPYAESLVATLSRYQGRVGTPDLDVSVPLNRLRRIPAPAPETPASPR